MGISHTVEDDTRILLLYDTSGQALGREHVVGHTGYPSLVHMSFEPVHGLLMSSQLFSTSNNMLTNIERSHARLMMLIMQVLAVPQRHKKTNITKKQTLSQKHKRWLATYYNNSLLAISWLSYISLL